MATVLVTYDLKTPGADYVGLAAELKSLGTWWHHLESTWFIVTDETPDELFERLRPHLGANDKLLILTVQSAPLQGWLNQRAWTWLDNNLE